MRVIYLLVLLAAHSTCLVGILSQSSGSGRPCGEQKAEAKPTLVREPDLDVIAAVLSDMTQGRWEYPTLIHRRRRGRVVVSMHSRKISDLEITRHFGDKNKRLTTEIRADIVRRSQALPTSLELLKPSDDVFMVDHLSHLQPACDLREAHRGEHAWARFWSPGYSSDRATAVMILNVGLIGGAHSQYCAIGLSKENGTWTVRWRRCTFYL